MLFWEQVKEGSVVYLAKSVEVNAGVIAKFTKCTVVYSHVDETILVVEEGEFKDYELHFYAKESKPEDLMTENELRLWKQPSLVKTGSFNSFEVAYVMTLLGEFRDSMR